MPTIKCPSCSYAHSYSEILHSKKWREFVCISCATTFEARIVGNCACKNETRTVDRKLTHSEIVKRNQYRMFLKSADLNPTPGLPPLSGSHRSKSLLG